MQPTKYKKLQVILPEGGYAVIYWPEFMEEGSVEMLREIFNLQMDAHLKFMARQAAMKNRSEGEEQA